MSLEERLAQVEARCRSARDAQALAFIIANETWQALPYRQAQVWRRGSALGAELVCVSGLAVLAEDSPFTVWAKRLMRGVLAELDPAVHVVDLAALAQGRDAPAGVPGMTPERIEGWEEWWPRWLALVPLAHKGEPMGAVLILLDQAPDRMFLAALRRLQSTWSYCGWALSRAPRRARLSPLGKGRWRWLALPILIAALAWPVHQTALAPAEIIALEGMAITAPLDGVLGDFDVRPNQLVHAGARLFALDDTTLRNRREVSHRALEVAEAEWLSAQQRAFNDPQVRGELSVLQGRIAERRADLQGVEAQLQRVVVRAPRDGIAVFGDADDWRGRPVATGERILQLADPNDMGVLLHLPVADAITLDEGARIRLFLDVAPLTPLDASLVGTSYQATLTADGVSAYRLRAAFAQPPDGTARIGLQGTAKIYGQRVSLAYYLLRRPLAALRQWTGL